MSQDEKQLVPGGGVLDRKSEFGFIAAFPFKARYGYIFFVKIDGGAGSKKQDAGNDEK